MINICTPIFQCLRAILVTFPACNLKGGFAVFIDDIDIGARLRLGADIRRVGS